jgi:predicted transcriptional regulator
MRKKRNSNKEIILDCITKNEPTGISTSDLSNSTGLHRDTIHSVCLELTKENIIYKANKKGKYHLTKQAAQDPILQYTIFGQDSFRELLKSFPHYMTNKQQTQKDNEDACKEIDKTNEFLKHVKTDDERVLLNFMLDCGKLLLYILLRAVEPYETKEDGKIKREKSIIMTRKSIDPIVILNEFVELSIVKKGIARKMSKQALMNNINPALSQEIKEEILQSYRTIDPFLFSPYEVDQSTFAKLEKLYKENWPYSFKALEYLKESLPRTIHTGIKTSLDKEDIISKIQQIKKNREEKLKRRQSSST